MLQLRFFFYSNFLVRTFFLPLSREKQRWLLIIFNVYFRVVFVANIYCIF